MTSRTDPATGKMVTYVYGDGAKNPAIMKKLTQSMFNTGWNPFATQNNGPWNPMGMFSQSSGSNNPMGMFSQSSSSNNQWNPMMTFGQLSPQNMFSGMSGMFPTMQVKQTSGYVQSNQFPSFNRYKSQPSSQMWRRSLQPLHDKIYKEPTTYQYYTDLDDVKNPSISSNIWNEPNGQGSSLYGSSNGDFLPRPSFDSLNIGRAPPVVKPQFPNNFGASNELFSPTTNIKPYDTLNIGRTPLVVPQYPKNFDFLQGGANEELFSPQTGIRPFDTFNNGKAPVTPQYTNFDFSKIVSNDEFLPPTGIRPFDPLPIGRGSPGRPPYFQRPGSYPPFVDPSLINPSQCTGPSDLETIYKKLPNPMNPYVNTYPAYGVNPQPQPESNPVNMLREYLKDLQQLQPTTFQQPSDYLVMPPGNGFQPMIGKGWYPRNLPILQRRASQNSIPPNYGYKVIKFPQDELARDSPLGIYEPDASSETPLKIYRPDSSLEGCVPDKTKK